MMTLRQLMATFPTEEACKQFLQDRRWPNGITCPRCGTSTHVYALTNMPWRWECANKACRIGHAFRFSIISGTIFENTKYPLRTWFEVLWSMLNAKKGISALQIQRQIGAGSYKTAFYMCHRLRAGMQDADFCKLMGIVEVDETYVGGKNKNKHRDKRRGRGVAGKVPIIGAIARKGNVIARVAENLTADAMNKFVRSAVSENVELVATDEHPSYLDLVKFFNHESVDHSKDEYVRGVVHTGTIDGFWSLLKRGIMGSYHHVSKKYLPLYVNEFSYRYNNRENDDIFGQAIAGC
jgi:transposase-like protein